MKPIPAKLRRELSCDPFYAICARKDLHGHICGGRITWEHALIYAGSQLQARFAIIPLCAKAHDVDAWQDSGNLDKEVNVWIALNRASEEELASISRAIDYRSKRERLNTKYGIYREASFAN